MADIPGEGFEVGAAFVSVSPEAGDFQAEVEAIVGETDIIVNVPVVPDAEGFRAALEEEVSAGDTAVTVPVVPDTAGFRLLLEDGIAGSNAPVVVPVVPDTAAFREKLAADLGGTEAPVEVPVVPDTAGFGEKLAADTDAEAGTAGEEAGASFREKFAAVVGEMDLAGYFAGTEAEAGAAGEASGAAFGEKLAATTETEAAAAGEAAGLTFSERFSAIAARAVAAIPGFEVEGIAAGEAAGAATGESFMGRLKGVVSGDMPVMEALLGAGFVAVTAVMASSFQSAMEKIHTQAGVAQSAIQGLSNQVLDLAGKVGESPDSLAASLYHVESAFQSNGITASAALHDVQIAAEGARTGGADLIDTTNALTALMKSGLVGGANSAAQAMGALNAIVGSGDMTMQDFTMALGSGLVAQAPLYHQSIVQVGAALATLGDENIRGAKAATDLRMAWQAIQSPLKTADSWLQHLGLTSTTLADTMVHHGLSGAIDQFVGRLKASHVPIGEWGQYVTEIFGKRAGAGIGVLTEQVGNLNLKLGDVAGGMHNFGNAWADTEKTTSQKLHQMEAGFEALMIKIGQGLLPVLGKIFDAVTKALPSIEKMGSSFLKVASPVVKLFFTGLAGILHLLLGPLRDVTIAVGALAAAWLVLDAISPLGWVVIAVAALVTLVGAIIKYRNDIKNALGDVVKWIHDHWILAAAGLLLILGPFGLIIAAVIKFHTQIVNAFKDVEKAFDAFKSFVTSSFDSWWASHGKELEQVWDTVWNAITGTIKTVWDTITGIVSAGWDLVGPFITAGLDILEGVFKVTWDAIKTAVKTAWDIMAAVVKIGVATIKLVIKTAWDVIVGIFSIALDLLTGHWSKAWNDMKKLVTQIWNNIKSYIGSVWNDISRLAVQIWNNITSFLHKSWDTIRHDAATAFDQVRHAIAHVWDEIVADAEHYIGVIISKIAGIGSTIIGIPGKILNDLNPFSGASGGIVPGSGTGDHVPALLTPGETVVSRAHSALLAPAFSAVGVPGYSGGGVVSSYGGMRRYAGGGAVGWGGGNDVGSLLMALVQALSGGQGWGGGRGMAGGGNAISMVFNGTSWPTPEQQQAMKLMLTSAVSNA